MQASFLPPNVLAFAVVTNATREYFEEYFAGVSHEGDATVSCHTPSNPPSCATPLSLHLPTVAARHFLLRT